MPLLRFCRDSLSQKNGGNVIETVRSSVPEKYDSERESYIKEFCFFPHFNFLLPFCFFAIHTRREGLKKGEMRITKFKGEKKVQRIEMAPGKMKADAVMLEIECGNERGRKPSRDSDSDFFN